MGRRYLGCFAWLALIGCAAPAPDNAASPSELDWIYEPPDPKVTSWLLGDSLDIGAEDVGWLDRIAIREGYAGASELVDKGLCLEANGEDVFAASDCSARECWGSQYFYSPAMCTSQCYCLGAMDPDEWTAIQYQADPLADPRRLPDLPGL